MTMDIEVHPLTPDRAADYLAFFDHEHGPAFSDNPEWATCYCQFYQTPTAVDWKSRGGGVNRRAMSERISTGEMEGFLAYVRDAGSDKSIVVGWLNAQPRNKLPHCFQRIQIDATPIDLPDHRVAQLVCFVIHPEWRRRGIARALLDAALDSFSRRGIVMVEAYPFKAEDSEDPGDHYHGTWSMLQKAGFEVFAEAEWMTIVRKTLRPQSATASSASPVSREPPESSSAPPAPSSPRP